MYCTRCQGTGFLNLHQVDEETLKNFEKTGDYQIILDWIAHNDDHDVTYCDCCGDGRTGWYDDPGEHDPRNFGKYGPYEYNGGLPECY